MALMVKNLPANVGDVRDGSLIPGLGRTPGRAWQPTPVFLPGESHGQRSLAGYGPEGCKESIGMQSQTGLKQFGMHIKAQVS